MHLLYGTDTVTNMTNTNTDTALWSTRARLV